MSTFGKFLEQYMMHTGKDASMRLSELGLSNSNHIADITMEVNALLRDSVSMTNTTVWNIMTAGGVTDPSLETAIYVLEQTLEEWKRLHQQP